MTSFVQYNVRGAKFFIENNYWIGRGGEEFYKKFFNNRTASNDFISFAMGKPQILDHGKQVFYGAGFLLESDLPDGHTIVNVIEN